MSSSKGKDVPPPSPAEGSCHFFIKRKHRYCRFTTKKDTTYCAEHAGLLGNELGRKRIECPYDAKHTCYEDKLKHHMKKCPSQPKEMPAYHCAGINSGDDGGEIVPHPKVTVLTVAIEELQSIIEKVNRLYDVHIGSIEEDILSHPCLKSELENPQYGTAALRHRRQQASLIGQMDKQGLLKDGMCYLEMGAGKGQLSHWLHGAVEPYKDVGFVLIDRSHVRNKMDNLHKEEQVMERIRMDIEHLKLEHVPSIEKHGRPIVAFGKHLCGPATDLTLRCITGTLCQTDDKSGGDAESERKRFKSGTSSLAGTVIALCCHHRCTWTAYVGKHFFTSCGFTARDFQILTSMSSWATCAWKGWSQNKIRTNTDKDSKSEDTVNGSNKEVIKNENLSKGDNLFPINKEDILKGDTSLENETENKIEMNIDTDSATIKHKKGTDVNVEDKDLAPEEDASLEEEHKDDEEATNTSIQSKLSQDEREVIGRKCKRLIDHGRVCFMQEHGLTGSLKVYIEGFYTPENVVLIATS